MHVARYFRLALPVFMLAGVAFPQSLAPETAAVKAAAIMEGRTATRTSSNGSSPAQTFARESRVFAHTPAGASLGAVRAMGNDRRFDRKADRSQLAGANREAAASPQAGGALALGQPLTLPLNLPAVSEPTLFIGDYGFQVTVPAGASRLEISLNAAPSSAQVALFARFGVDVDLASGQVVADYFSPGISATERIVVTASSTPPLRAGTHFIAFGLFSTSTAVSGSITVTAFPADPTPQTGSQLTSGVPAAFSLPAVPSPTLFNGEYGYLVNVPAGARSLEVTLSTPTPGAGINLYARFGQDVTVADGSVIADLAANGPTGSQRILITPDSSPALSAGTYYLALGYYDVGSPVSGTIKATVDTGNGNPAPVNFTYSFPAVTQPTLFSGDYGTRIVVPQGATKLVINIDTTTRNADVDLYVRFGQDVGLAGGRPVADYLSEGPTGDETITITTSSAVPLRAGTYYIAYGLFTNGVPVNGTGTATITVSTSSPTPTPTPSDPNTTRQACAFSLPQASANTLFTGDYSCHFAVPDGATRLEIKMSPATPNVDVVLFVRAGADIQLLDGNLVADYSSSGDGGDQTIVITPSSTHPLKGGFYYAAFGVLTMGTAIQGTVTAAVTK
jgi:hypothetical protein